MQPPVDWQARLRGSIWYIIAALVLVWLVLGAVFAYQSRAEWTGFYEFVPTPTPEVGQATPLPPGAGPQIASYKKLWDWMELLIVPLVLAIFGILFSQLQKDTELAVQESKEQESATQSLLDRMTELILTGQLQSSPEDSPVRDLAKTRVLTALQSLNSTRKLMVLRFLLDANLIRVDNGIIQMDGANFTRADFRGASILRARINGANFNHAWLSGANFSDSDLSLSTFDRSKMEAARLVNAFLVGCSLTHARLDGANLDRANLHKSNFRKSSLSRSGLTEARLSETNLEDTDFRGATLNGAVFGGARMIRTKFLGAKLRAAVFTMDPAVQQANQELAEKGIENLPTETVVDRADFDQADLEGADFSGVNLTRVRGLNHAVLRGVNFSRVKLAGVDLRGADLSGAVLDCAEISRRLITSEQLASVKSKVDLVLVE